MMVLRAGQCAKVLGVSRKLRGLGPEDGTRLLLALMDTGSARSTLRVTYAAGLRMLKLAGVSVEGWPSPPPAPRKLRKPVTEAEIASLCADLTERGHADTASLVKLMRDTGLRVNVEALKGDWRVEEGPTGAKRIRVLAGKGGHERVIPYKGLEREPMRGVTYETHLRRIKLAAKVTLGRDDITPHDLRRAFVKRAYEGSGKDLRVAQVLAGHASPSTTADYIGVDYAELEAALY
jgi:integrase